MAGITNYLLEAVLDHALRGSPYTPPADIYLGLHTNNPGNDGAANEVDGGGYVRQVVSFSAADAGSITSSGAALFTLPACTVRHFSLWDASSAGNCLFVSSSFVAMEFNPGDTLNIQAGALVITQVGA